MSKILSSLFSRIFVRTIGLNVRFLFFRIIKKPRKRSELSNSFKDDYNDYANAVNQDVLNTIVGSTVLIILAGVLFLFL